MEIPKEKILELLRERGQNERADQAASELPDHVDHQQHAGVLSKFGVEPKDLLDKLPGGLGEKFNL